MPKFMIYRTAFPCCFPAGLCIDECFEIFFALFLKESQKTPAAGAENLLVRKTDPVNKGNAFGKPANITGNVRITAKG